VEILSRRTLDHFGAGCQKTIIYDQAGLTILCQKEEYDGEVSSVPERAGLDDCCVGLGRSRLAEPVILYACRVHPAVLKRKLKAIEMRRMLSTVGPDPQ
jgi:hypothetical protein